MVVCVDRPVDSVPVLLLIAEVRSAASGHLAAAVCSTPVAAVQPSTYC